MQIVKSVSVWRDSIGFRLTVTSSTVDETTDHVVGQDARETILVRDDDVTNHIVALLAYAQERVDSRRSELEQAAQILLGEES